MAVSVWQDGICLEIKVQPRSSRNKLVGNQQGIWKVKLTAPPVDGEANQALVSFLADIFGVSKQSVKILRGDTSKLKLVGIHGVSPGQAAEVLENLSGKK
ncbi:MAG: YggU family protein [Syntrophomonadaceae bacterium]|nr:YggU family protein [Syntrophomonadaceae bacterium]